MVSSRPRFRKKVELRTHACERPPRDADANLWRIRQGEGNRQKMMTGDGAMGKRQWAIVKTGNRKSWLG